MRRLLIALPLLTASPAFADPLHDAVTAEMPSLMTIYKQLHASPELAFQEQKTATFLAGEFRKLGFAVTTGVGKTGVVAVMKNGPGPVVMLRTDMDGLCEHDQGGNGGGQGNADDACLRSRHPYKRDDRHCAAAGRHEE
jgi:hippurate hydrolase